jgi:hypothetical protein
MHRSNELRPLWIVSERAPHVADQHVQSRRIDVAVGPESRLQLIFIEHIRAVRQERGQQVERLPRQVNLVAATQELTRLGVERERSESGFHAPNLTAERSGNEFSA